MRRMILVPLLIFLALAAIGGGIAYWVYNNYTFYQTDDAQVTGPIVNINAPVAGTLTSLTIQPGAAVTAGEQIGTITLASSQTATNANATPTTINLTSPMNGTVLQVPAVANQIVAPGLQIASLTDLGSITITAYIDESAINNVNVGQAVDISIDAYSGTSFTGHVKLIVAAAAGTFSLLPNQDPTSGNFTKVGQRIPVVISLDGTSGKAIFPGMSAEVTIHLH
ncbi:MAG TPA: efflux RND transporter periplasmic adaptor subunit [Ktedonobacteraceae bacterium]|nr:efflux RND transporter periplasmic adaptor subunit [Ktedonobacteraceae bacterium]